MVDHNKRQRYLISALTGLFAVVLLKTAWIGDDPYITFRTIDNFMNGYGLTWNIGERVQAYTHPLWLFLITALHFLTREFHFTSIFISITLSLIIAVVLSNKISPTWWSTVLGLTILILSKSFIDYSTSGLENPLTHLLLVLFYCIYLKKEPSPENLFLMSLLAALGLTNRMDTALFFVPPLLHMLWMLPKRKAIAASLLGFIPFLAWELFSIIYYGFPFPNTAYAKLGINLPISVLIPQGLAYLRSTIYLDPITIIVIIGGLLIPVITRKRRHLFTAIGSLLYIIYVIRIGGDFMSGRFFSAPLLIAAVLIIDSDLLSQKPYNYVSAIAILGIGLVSPFSPVLSEAQYGVNLEPLEVVDKHGIADERAFYYRFSGLLSMGRQPEWNLCFWSRNLLLQRTDYYDDHHYPSSVIVHRAVGMYGYCQGPEVWIIDIMGLGDPLLARLPPRYDINWRVGHMLRIVPDGYMETVGSGINKLKDPKLAAYYERLLQINRDPLWTADRFKTIIGFNLGLYNHLVDVNKYKYPNRVHVPLSTVNYPKPAGIPYDQPGLVKYNEDGILIKLEQVYHAPKIQIGLDRRNIHLIRYMKGDLELAERYIPIPDMPLSGLAVTVVTVPDDAMQEGYDRVWILPTQHDRENVLGFIKLLEP